MQLKFIYALLAAIALTATGLVSQGQAEEEFDCPDELDGIELSSRQASQLQQLEMHLDNRIDAIMPISIEDEAKVEQLEENFERQITALFSPQQKQQIEQLDRWVEEQMAAIAPVLFEEEDPILTPEQEEAIEAVEEDYERRLESMLTPEQQQRIFALEERLEADLEVTDDEAQHEQLEENFERQMEAILASQQRQQIARLDHWADEQMAMILPELFGEEDPELTPEQEAQLEVIEEEYEQRFQSLLTAPQQQRIATLEQRLDEEIDAILPEPSAQQEARIEAAEEEFERGVLQILTDEQRQQWQRNMVCDVPEAE